MTLGFRVLTRERKVPGEVVEKFRQLPVANVSDSMSRMFGAGPRLTMMHRDGPLSGAALTVKTRHHGDLGARAPIDMAEPGDVDGDDHQGQHRHHRHEGDHAPRQVDHVSITCRSRRHCAHSPPRITGSVEPSAFTPSMSILSEPIIQSMWMRLELPPCAAICS